MERRRSTFVSPNEIEKFVRLFESGEIATLSCQIDLTVEKIRHNDALLKTEEPKTSIKRFFVELTVFILHVAYDYGVDIDKIMDFKDPYEEIFSFTETCDIKQWFISNCLKLYYACEETTERDKEKLANAVERFIKDNIQRKDLGIPVIADSFGYSVSYLSKSYSSIKGSSIIDCIMKERIRVACKYLESGTATIQEASEKAGFSSVNYFYRRFKQMYGITPKEYKSSKKRKKSTNEIVDKKV